MPLDGSPRILITRTSAVGDCILTIPMLCALREHYPQAMLAWVTEPGPAQILGDHPDLDQLLVTPKGWLKSPARIRRIRHELRELQIDTVLDPQSLTKSAALGWLSGAARRIGFARPRGRELAIWLNRDCHVATAPHLVDAQLELLQQLDVKPGTARFRLPAWPEAEPLAEQFVRQSHLGGGFVVLNPGAGWESRVWPAESYGRLARQLGEELNLPSVVVWSGAAERAAAERIQEKSGGHAVLAPPTTLRELAAILRRTQLFVGSDTGPLHLASAVGTRCVGLYGTTHPDASGPYGDQHRVVQAYFQQYQTSRERRRATNEAMQAITPETVFQVCHNQLQCTSSTAEPNAA
ncbi:MAG: glycosyltransferase family 9 protein [Planctomycetota bacterium]|nr:glycosyltransferase family 9 protein [Planctomycetota bacterium]